MAQNEQRALEALPDAIVVADDHGRVALFNAAAERLFGYASAEIVGRDVALLFSNRETTHPGRQWEELFTAAQQTEGGSEPLEVRARHSNGEAFSAWFSVRGMDDQGQPHYVAIVRDLSAQKADAEQLRSLEARLSALTRLALAGEVAASMAHEINQPLTAIATYAQAAKRVMDSSVPDLRMLKDVCEKMDQQARRAGDVVQGIRELIYRPKPQAEVLDINSIVEDVMSLIEADARIEGASVTVDYTRPLPPVRGDALHLQAVLLSLARNSFEAMRDGSRQERRILIRTSLDDKGRVRVSVSDRGPGVAAPLEGRIFDPFVTTNRKRLGIGLSISHSVVKAHEGGLTYERNSEGESTFVVDLPPCYAEAPQ